MISLFSAVKCNCGYPTCRDWHVAGVAQVQGVCFTREQAEAVAKLLNSMEDGAHADDLLALRDQAKEANRLREGLLAFVRNATRMYPTGVSAQHIRELLDGAP